MPELELVNPPELGPTPGFSHATVFGDLVFVGGQIGCDGSGRVVAPGDLVAQFAQAIRNVATALRAAGSAPERAVRLTYYVTDLAAYRSNLEDIGRAYRESFGRHYPASSLFQVSGLFDPEAMVEIECVAARGGDWGQGGW